MKRSRSANLQLNLALQFMSFNANQSIERKLPAQPLIQHSHPLFFRFHNQNLKYIEIRTGSISLVEVILKENLYNPIILFFVS